MSKKTRKNEGKQGKRELCPFVLCLPGGVETLGNLHMHLHDRLKFQEGKKGVIVAAFYLSITGSVNRHSKCGGKPFGKHVGILSSSL